jgi:hypothetical protein
VVILGDDGDGRSGEEEQIEGNREPGVYDRFFDGFFCAVRGWDVDKRIKTGGRSDV